MNRPIMEPLRMTKTLGTIGVMAGVPSIPREFTKSLAELLLFSQQYVCPPGTRVHVEWANYSLHFQARNNLASSCRGDWILMLDCDHAFEPDLLLRLLRLMELSAAQVVTGVYQFKGGNHSPVLHVWNRERECYLPIDTWDTGGGQLLPVDAAGAGCLLVRREVFRRMAGELGEMPFTHLPGLGEDLSFFTRCRQLGIQPYAAVNVECHHLLTVPLTLADYQPDTWGAVSIPAAALKVDGPALGQLVMNPDCPGK